jgi:hypothetical protein
LEVKVLPEAEFPTLLLAEGYKPVVRCPLKKQTAVSDFKELPARDSRNAR